MRSAMFLVLALTVVFFLNACGTRYVRLNKDAVFTPKERNEDVEIFTDTKPTRPYTEIATMFNDTGDYEDIIKGFRRRARELGADAVIVKMDLTRTGVSSFWRSTQQAAYATAIKYK